MLNLKDHPFAVEAFFERSLVLSFATPAEVLKSKIPSPLELDLFDDKWAFLTVAMVQTKKLRPKGFPSFLGNDFFLIGYRVFVRYTDLRGKNLRGLYILKSETDSDLMTSMGNFFTHYNYSKIDLLTEKTDGNTGFSSVLGDFSVKVNEQNPEPQLPSGSPFSNWKEARRFAGPLPFTFTLDEKENSILIIEGVRQNWKPLPVDIADYRFGFIDSLKIPDIKLANAFEVSNVPYYWKKGRKEILK